MENNRQHSSSERRVFKRAQYECKINICYSNETLTATVKNIGQGGVLVVFDKEMPRGLPVQLEVFLDQGKIIKCEGNIVWSLIKTDIFGDSKTVYETGIQFIRLSDEDKGTISIIVSSMEKEQGK
jgi:c-di-GMP-binding flagellar brake protein YcgR